MKKHPTDRLNYSGDLEPVIDRLCSAFRAGEPDSFTVVEVGYEDCNVIIETSGAKYLAKIFSKDRKPADVHRYTEIMHRVTEAGVHHPELFRTDSGSIVYTDRQANGISAVLTRFIEGGTFFELDRAPSLQELKKVLEQAARINAIDYKPSYIFDSWAIPNIHSMLERVRNYIKSDDMKLVQEAISRYEKIPINSLPHCFVHGDFTKANVIRAIDGRIYILDFSVSNWYPRIQELAVITANLLYDRNDPMPLGEKADLVAEEYSKFSPLTAEEKDHLYTYTLAGIAMEFMGSHQEKFIKGNDAEETDYWMDLGKEGLRKALNNQ